MKFSCAGILRYLKDIGVKALGKEDFGMNLDANIPNPEMVPPGNGAWHHFLSHPIFDTTEWPFVSI
jgi:hypothetical protein